MPEGK